MAPCYEIYPPIGVARVGNAVYAQDDPQYWFIGPEIPGKDPVPEGGFKNKKHCIKRSAQRFRIYEFDNDKVVREITHTQDIEIKWTVHVANKKASWVTFRGQYSAESWHLRNGTVQPWPSSGHSFAYCDERKNLIVDSGEVPISGTCAGEVSLKGKFYGSKATAIDVQLGALRTDDAGRLIVIPGDGKAYNVGTSQATGMDNDDWIDTVFDGHVNATVCINGTSIQCTRATVISAPPHFGNGLQGPISLYDLVEDVYDRQKRSDPNYSVGDVIYYEHIYPLFRRLYMMSWTSENAHKGHGVDEMEKWFGSQWKLYDPTGHAAYRRNIFKKVRLYVVKEQPEQIPTDARPTIQVNPQNAEDRRKQAAQEPNLMPPLGGGPDGQISLTQLQYERLQKWSDGKFTTGSLYQPPEKFDNIPLKDQPDALRVAASEWSVGGSFYPGIECYWIAEFGQMYDLTKPFRFGDLAKPGHLTRGLSLPWQSDFNACGSYWWPSARPSEVVTRAYFDQVQSAVPPDQLASKLTQRKSWTRGLDDMVQSWYKLGFISSIQYPLSDKEPILVEGERDLDGRDVPLIVM